MELNVGILEKIRSNTNLSLSLETIDEIIDSYQQQLKADKIQIGNPNDVVKNFED